MSWRFLKEAEMKLNAVVLVAVAALVAGPVQAADLPDYDYPDLEVPELPPVDYDLGGSFYLRGSVGGNAFTTREHISACGCTTTAFTEAGYGYSFGAGLGFETGTGWRADVTADYLQNSGLSDGAYKLSLRSSILLANAYYDFNFGGGHSADGGFGAYVGLGIGGAYNQTTVDGPLVTPDGQSYSPVGALMAGVTYDMGAIVADVGYRGLYMPTISNNQVAPNTSYYLNGNMIHEVRGTIRYRFN
jgi:hypothetical protein